MSDILAVKYRPKKLSDVVGQEQAVRVLTNSIQSGKFHHAYIFSGKFGTGKTSCARIFAASLNNPNGVTLEPNVDSKIIQSIFAGSHIDIKEIDAASQNSIDGMRELKNSIQMSPVEARYRFVILDESHRLSAAATEAALKMIEEPPPKTIFILATTDPQKIKDTIHSRCLSLSFNPVIWSDIFAHLKDIADKENIKYEDGALKVAARKSKGSVRNALQNLQMLSTLYGEDKITTDAATTALDMIDDNSYFDFMDSILQSDASQMMKSVQNMVKNENNVEEVIDGLVMHLRNLLISYLSSDDILLNNISEEDQKRYAYQLSKMPDNKKVDFITYLIDQASYISRGVRFNINAQTMFENFAIKSIAKKTQLSA